MASSTLPFGRHPQGREPTRSEAGSPLKIGSDDHKQLFCQALLLTHDPYRPALIEWPMLDEATREKIVSLPIWDIAVQTEGRAGMNVASYAACVTDPVLKAAIEMNAFEETRHKTVLADMVGAYQVTLEPEPDYAVPKDREWAFMVTGFSECIDSFFGFGLFDIAKNSGFFPLELVETFEPVMREEGRHILFFVNWVEWRRRSLSILRRFWFDIRVAAVWAFLIWERMGLAQDMEKSPKAQDNNFTLTGSKELGVQITFAELLGACLRENDRRLAPYDPRLLRPSFVPSLARLALKFSPGR